MKTVIRVSQKTHLYVLMTATLALAGHTAVFSAPADYSPPVANPYPDQLYWGDLHLHSNLSGDAFALGGNKTITPELAYRFARGETITSQFGVKARLARPLDFLLIADHADLLGIFP